MWKNKLKELIYILEHSDINEIEATFWGRKYRVVKNATMMGAGQPALIQHTGAPDQPVASESAAGGDSESTHMREIRSPMPGTFYGASGPDESPYVNVGDTVKKGDSLCIVEAMKIMNEIESSISGVVKEVLVENGKAVEYNQPLFRIE